MELSWSTFILEMINFLVLVWILKRFLYRPVLNAIAERRAAIESQRCDMQRLHDEAVELEKQYKGRIESWQKEKQTLTADFRQEMEKQRSKGLENLQLELSKTRENAAQADRHQAQESAKKLERQALQQGAEFASRLLQLASGPELEQRLVELFLQQLKSLGGEQKAPLLDDFHNHGKTVSVNSAFVLSDANQQQLREAINQLLDREVECVFSQQPELLAGLLVSMGAWVLRANVRDELKGFAEFDYAAG